MRDNLLAGQERRKPADDGEVKMEMMAARREFKISAMKLPRQGTWRNFVSEAGGLCGAVLAV